uniref:Uncharacterized protein n=1 Tax=Anguilla anguilla TaxID=7936 RepID=A0A0E9UCU9_ANGAN
MSDVKYMFHIAT